MTLPTNPNGHFGLKEFKEKYRRSSNQEDFTGKSDLD
jgi:hypothetical protein